MPESEYDEKVVGAWQRHKMTGQRRWICTIDSCAFVTTPVGDGPNFDDAQIVVLLHLSVVHGILEPSQSVNIEEN